MKKNRLVSTAILRERIEEVKEKRKEQKRFRAEDDPFFKHTEWVILEFEQAIRDAAREYVPTMEAAELTGWSPQTLRTKAHKVRAGEDPGPGWEDLQVRASGGEWAFCVSTIPVKSSRVA